MDIRSDHVQTVKFRIANEIEKAGCDRSAAEVFWQRQRRQIGYDAQTDSVTVNGLPIGRVFAENPRMVDQYRAPAITEMSRSAFKEKMLSGDQFEYSKVRLVDDPPQAPAVGPGVVTRAEYRQMMIDGVQGLDKITHFAD